MKRLMLFNGIYTRENTCLIRRKNPGVETIKQNVRKSTHPTALKVTSIYEKLARLQLPVVVPQCSPKYRLRLYLLQGYNSLPDGKLDEVSLIVDVQLVHQAGFVPLHGLGADHQHIRYFTHRMPLCK